MLIRREYAPARSPTSFSYGGGAWKGFTSRILSNSCAFGFSPAASSFLESRCAWRVNTNCHFTKEAPASIFGRASSARVRSRLASLGSRANIESLELRANRPQRSVRHYSFLKRCGLARVTFRTLPAISKASLFQRSQFSCTYSGNCCIKDTRFFSDNQFALPPQEEKELAISDGGNRENNANQRRLTSRNTALALCIGDGNTRIAK
jgi:hypothetical protein